ncbi:MAG: arsenic resistance protein [Clostridia bacterium]|nr:arsenic resistance protein [Clostridia bacterium]
MKKIFFYPSKNLTLVIPVTLLAGLIMGNLMDLSMLKILILPATFAMIYPTMIGFQLKTAFDLSYGKVVFWSILLNFVLIPLLAYGLGMAFLGGHPMLFAGLAIASLLPTSGMTISWTMLTEGNVAAAVKMTVIGLLLGSLLAPWYLLVMIGQYVPIDVAHIFKIIAIVVMAPLILGHFTYQGLLRRYTVKEFQKKFKPVLPSFSVWAMLLVIFASMGMRAPMILGDPSLLLSAMGILLVFYLANFALSTIVARLQFQRGDALALVFGTVLRNLSIALGIAVTAFDAQAALIVTLAFIIQVQGATWYGKLADNFGFFPTECSESTAA